MRERKTAEARREEIVEAALVLIDRGGLALATTSAIAQQIGISQAAVFRHFRKKDDILLAVVDEIAGQVICSIRSSTEGPGSPIDRLRAFVHCLLTLVAHKPVMPAILFSRELHAENALLRAAVYQRIGRVHDMLSEMLAAGVREGALRADLDTDRGAFMLIGLMQGLVVRWSLSDRNLDLVREGHSMFEMLLQGFLGDGGDEKA